MIAKVTAASLKSVSHRPLFECPHFELRQQDLSVAPTVSIDTYEQALAFLHSRINYERTSASLSATDFKLERMRNLLERLGNPHDRIPTVHIAGTKGKGSTAAMMSAALHRSGYTVGLFTSPHLEHFEERVQVNGRCIDADSLVRLVRELAEVTARIDSESPGLNPTFFELTTSLGWLYFIQQRVDVAVLEVGLGGRLDSTNICRPDVCIITTISRDHTQVLGTRLSEIAAEKAGIIKECVPIVSGVLAPEAREVIEQVAAQRSAALTQLGRDFSYEFIAPQSVEQRPRVAVAFQSSNDRDDEHDEFELAMLGQHQAHNTALVAAALRVLRQRCWCVPAVACREALSSVVWPARIEQVRSQPTVILDAAHNWASVGALLKTLSALPCSGRRCLILSTTKDKDSAGLLRRLLPAFDTIIVTQYVTNPRATPATELASLAASISSRAVHLVPDPAAALARAKALTTSDDLICIAGSFFLAAELRPLITAADWSVE